MKIENQNNSMTIFNYLGNSVRTIKKPDGSLWFVAKDLQKITGHKKINVTIKKALDPDERGTTMFATSGGLQKVTIINESGLYHLLLISRMPKAKPFRKHVTSVILPTIRKTGQFTANNQNTVNNADFVKEYELTNQMQKLKALRLQAHRKITNIKFELNELQNKRFAIAVPEFNSSQLAFSF